MCPAASSVALPSAPPGVPPGALCAIARPVVSLSLDPLLIGLALGRLTSVQADAHEAIA